MDMLSTLRHSILNTFWLVHENKTKETMINLNQYGIKRLNIKNQNTSRLSSVLKPVNFILNTKSCRLSHEGIGPTG